MAFNGTIQDLQSAEVVDSSGDKIGKVGQVYLYDGTQEPTWVTVNTGFFGTKESFIPLTEAEYADGRIRVPYEKSFVKDAPQIDPDGAISVEEEDELYRYYGVTDDRAAADGEGRTAEQGRGAGDGANGPASPGQTGPGTGTTGAAGAAGAGAGADLGAGAGTRTGQHERTGASEGAAGAGAPRPGQETARDRAGDAGQQRHDGAGAGEGGESITLHEERANVGTERVETGKVRLRKHVVTDTETVQVPVEREEVVVERVPASGETGGRISADDVEVTLHEERPVVETETVATEQVNVGKRSVTDTEEVTTQTAHEELDVEGEEGTFRES